MSGPPPGWYHDSNDADRMRWWDGVRWTEHVSALPRSLSQPQPAERSNRHRGLPWWVWALIAVLAVGLLVVVSPLLAVAALTVLITGIVALAKGTPTWMRFSSRTATGVSTGIAAVVLVLSGGVAAAIYPSASQTRVTVADSAEQGSTALSPHSSPASARPTASTAPPAKFVQPAQPTPTTKPSSSANSTQPPKPAQSAQPAKPSQPANPAPPPVAQSRTVSGTVHPGAYCKKEYAGWTGFTVDHVKMICETAAGDSRLRWRRA